MPALPSRVAREWPLRRTIFGKAHLYRRSAKLREEASMRVCIFGAGAIGGYLAACLSRVPGVELALVARGAHLAAIQRNGLKLACGGSEEVFAVTATDDPRMLGPQDYVIICLKAHQAWEAA